MSRSDKPAKILIGGIFAGALTYGLGEMNTFRFELRVHELQRACVAETGAEAKKQKRRSRSEEAGDLVPVGQHFLRKNDMRSRRIGEI
jgi:hypothetical protein